MCGIAGIISRNGERQIGSEMTRMLQSMKHRGPDSTGYALYGPPSEGYVMRVKLADANTPRDYEFDDRMQRNKAEIERRLEQLGAHGASRSRTRRSTRFEAHFAYDGDLKALADRVEDVARRRGALARALAADRQGPRRRRDGRHAVQARQARRHARDRARPDGHGVRRRHLRRAPVLGVSVLRHRRRPQRAADELPPVEAAPGALRATGSSPSATRRSSPSTWPRRWPRAPTSRARCATRSRSSTASSPTSA